MYKALTDALTKPMSAKKAEVTLLEDSELNVFVPEEKAAPVFVAPAYEAKPSVKYEPPKPQVFEPIFKSDAGMGDIFKTPERVVEKETVSTSKGYTPNVFKQKDYTYVATQEPVFTINEAREEFAKSEPLATAPVEAISFTDTDSGVDTIWPIGQVDKTFIIAQSEDALYLIDQHAAHERILFDKLMAAKGEIPAQQLLMPLYIDMQSQDIALIEEHQEEFLRLGVDIAAAGEAMLRISSLPTDIKADDAEEFILEISKMLREMRTINPADLRQEVLHMTACKAAIKAGQLLNMRQMRQLIIDLCNTDRHPVGR